MPQTSGLGSFPPMAERDGFVVDTTLPRNVLKDDQRFIKEWVRFWWHALGISLVGALAVLITDQTVKVSMTLFVLAVFVWYEILRKREKLKHKLRTAWFWPLTSWMITICNKIKIRPHELDTRTSAMDFLAGLLLTMIFVSPEVLTIACFITAWADPLARVVGKEFGDTNWGNSDKTIIGSLACMFVTLAVTMLGGVCFYPDKPLVLHFAWVVAMLSTAAELIPQRKFFGCLTPADNFWLMVVSAGTLQSCVSFLV